MAGNPSFNTLVSTTIDDYVPELTDIIWSSRPGMYVLKKEGRIKNKAGGANCVVPLVVAESKNVGSYSGSDVFSTDDDDEISAAQYPWKQHYGLIKIDGITEAKNSGSKTQIIDILESRLEIVRETITENLDQILWGDGSGNGGKDFMGFKGIVSASDPSTGALGGLPVATNVNWRSPVNTTSEAFSAFGLNGMNKLMNNAGEGNDNPTHIFSYQAGYEAFEASLTNNARYMDPDLVDAGFKNLLYHGVPIVYDKYIDAGYMYFINMKYIAFYTLDNTWFTPSPLMSPANQDVKYKWLKTYGQLTTNNRKRHALKTGLTDV